MKSSPQYPSQKTRRHDTAFGRGNLRGLAEQVRTDAGKWARVLILLKRHTTLGD